MASLYRIVYRTTNDNLTAADVTASSEDNAWVAVQANDATAKDIESINEINANVWIGS